MGAGFGWSNCLEGGSRLTVISRDLDDCRDSVHQLKADQEWPERNIRRLQDCEKEEQQVATVFSAKEEACGCAEIAKRNNKASLPSRRCRKTKRFSDGVSAYSTATRLAREQ